MRQSRDSHSQGATHILDGSSEHLLNMAQEGGRKDRKGLGASPVGWEWCQDWSRHQEWEAGAHQMEQSTLAISLLFPELSATGELSWLYL